jgi:hypothetical protein
MGHYVTCPRCRTEVYTTSPNLPRHRDATDQRCLVHGEFDPEEYPVGYDGDPWVYQGGAWERDRRKF